ncbi:MAG: right-handed parallel beta-helix repeat-containing protein [Lysobacteraceae bacterium]
MIKNENVLVQDAARRGFLKQASGLAAAAAFGGFSLPALAAFNPPGRARGSKVISVKDKGAVGNGTHDDTSAFQAAINALPSTGGTVTVPAGTYLIDPVRGITLRSRMMLKLADGAVLKAKTNSAAVYHVIYVKDVSDVEIAGGQILGDRRTHHFGPGTNEWGHGVQLRNAKRVTVRDMRIADCTGDGMLVGMGSTDVVIANVVSTNNRRQGLSITYSSNVKVYDSEFSYTNGTKPQCGIDVEPGSKGCSGILIQNCRLNNNAKYGINVWRNAKDVTIANCTIENNQSIGMSATGAVGVQATGNTIRNNAATGCVYASGTRNVVHSGNLSYGNYARQGKVSRAAFTFTGYDRKKLQRDMLVASGTSGIAIKTNSYK